MPEITAEQLAAEVRERKAIAAHHGWYDAATEVRLTYTQLDHIIACLREHEERAAGCDPDDPAEAEQFQKFWSLIVSDHQDNQLSIGDAYRLKMRLFADRFSGYLSKAAVEKAVRNG